MAHEIRGDTQGNVSVPVAGHFTEYLRSTRSKQQQMVSVCFLLSHTGHNMKSKGLILPQTP